MLSGGDVNSCSIPIGSLGYNENKIILNFNHHAHFIDAKNDWDRRKVRINKSNLFIKMTLPNNNKGIAKRFDELPFNNKVCFCPQQLNFQSTVFIPRYIWRSLNKSITQGSNTLTGFLRDMRNMSITCDILKMLCGEDDFVREL